VSDVRHEPIPVVVLGLGLSALGTVRSLGRAGLRPYLVCPRGDLAGLTRWARGRVLRIEESADPDVLAEGLERLGFGGAVLIPCTDEWSEVVAKLAASSGRSFVTSAPDPAVVDLLVDKLRFAETVQRLDVPHPRTLAISNEEELDGLELEGYFFKPRNSQLFARRYHRKALTFDGSAQAHQAYRMIASVGTGAVLQEYIPGPPTDHYFIDGFLDRTGQIVALFARRRLRMFPLDFGNSTLMVSVPLSEVEGAVGSLRRLLPAIEYRGIFSAEFKRDPRDGLFKILEVNSRPWWFIEFAALCGVDVSVLAYRDALGLQLPELDGYTIGERCVLLPQDARAYRQLRSANELSLSSWLRSWVGARSTIFELSDPLPALSLPLLMARRAWRLARGS
jgi:D-aspartate ligase